MNSKAQISLEYILIALAVIAVISAITLSVTNLYSKNITAIDNKAIKNTAKELQSMLNIAELQPNFKSYIIINPLTEWEINKEQSNIILSNKNKEYLITSKNNIILYIKTIKKDTKIIVEKKDNIININIEELNESK